MAPNLVKSASLCSLDMSGHIAMSASASQITTPTYPPLTDANNAMANPWEDDAPSHENAVFGSSKMRRTPSVLFRIIVEEEAQKAVSCAHIETNLIADANREVDPNQVYHVNNNKEEEDSYWDMPSESDTTDAVSSGQVERLLVEDALRRIKDEMNQKPTVTNSHPNNSYWDWPSEPVLESEKKSNLIASIILEEAIRKKLSIDHITDIETSNKQTTPSQQIEASSAQANVSVDYWNWSAEEQNNHEIVAPHVHDASHPNNAYWDFPSKPCNPEDLKKQLIDKILNEERIRNILSSEAVEEREVNYHRHSREGHKKSDIVALESALQSVPSNYWDFNPVTEDLVSLVSRQKQELINRILKEEKQRFVLSTENIENNLRSSTCKGRVETAIETPSPTVESYWDW